MKKILVLVTCCLAAAMSPCLAEEVAEGIGNQCGPAGTWWGQNHTLEMEFLVTILPIGGGRYSVVADGNANAPVPPWERFTAFRGELVKVRHHTYDWTQISFGGPGVFSGDPGLPDIIGAHGEVVLEECDRFEVLFDFIPVYGWGKTPFVDDPDMEFPAPHFATYTRITTN